MKHPIYANQYSLKLSKLDRPGCMADDISNILAPANAELSYKIFMHIMDTGENLEMDMDTYKTSVRDVLQVLPQDDLLEIINNLPDK